jgi:thiol:disulfide interchange protein DsbA
MFNYICPACYSFDSQFHAWAAKQPAYVRDLRAGAVPPDYRLCQGVLRGRFAGRAGKTHEAVYKAVHLDHALPGEGQNIDPQKIAEFYARYGVTEAVHRRDEQLRRGRQDEQGQPVRQRSQIEGTPTVIIVNGKYR